MSFAILPGETLEELVPGRVSILQRERGFRFGYDAVLLAAFCRAGARDRICDLGTGGGVLPLLLAARVPACSLTGVEIDPALAAMAARSVEGNGLSGRIRILAGDFRDAQLLPAGRFSLAVSNPPYHPVGAGRPPASPEREQACTERSATLADVAAAAARLLRSGGRFCMVYPPARLCEAICALGAVGLAVKRLQLVLKNPASPPSLVLLEARKGAAEGVSILPPLLSGGAPQAGTPACHHEKGEHRS